MRKVSEYDDVVDEDVENLEVDNDEQLDDDDDDDDVGVIMFLSANVAVTTVVLKAVVLKAGMMTTTTVLTTVVMMAAMVASVVKMILTMTTMTTKNTFFEDDDDEINELPLIRPLSESGSPFEVRSSLQDGHIEVPSHDRSFGKSSLCDWSTDWSTDWSPNWSTSPGRAWSSNCCSPRDWYVTRDMGWLNVREGIVVAQHVALRVALQVALHAASHVSDGQEQVEGREWAIVCGATTTEHEEEE